MALDNLSVTFKQGAEEPQFCSRETNATNPRCEGGTNPIDDSPSVSEHVERRAILERQNCVEADLATWKLGFELTRPRREQ
jgi:hypothetical protein